MTKKAFFVLVAAILPLAIQAARFEPKSVSGREIMINEESVQTLFADGKVGFEIIVPSDAPPVAKFAAQELAENLSKVLGCKLGVVNQKSAKLPALIVGDIELARKNGMEPDKLDRDGFFIRSIGSDVLLIGVDSPGTISEQSEKGTLFAVYDFLERFAGIRFYFPGDIGTVTPLLQIWRLPQIDIAERPDFQYRRIYAVNAQRVRKSNERIIWYDDTKDKMMQYKLANLRYRMQTREIPNCHGLSALGLKDRFAGNKPEFFALNSLGKRIDGVNYSHPNDAQGQICFSSQELKNEIYLDAKAILTGQPPEPRGAFLANGKPAWNWKHHTPGEFFCVMPNDSCYLCRCPVCWKHFSGSSDGHYTQETTDYIWKFMAGIAKRLKDEGVPGYVTTMAYSQYRGIPSFELPDNMIIMLALTGPWNEGKNQQKKDDKLLKAWTEKLKSKIYLWTYPSKCWVQIRGVPNMAPKAVGEYFRGREPYIFGAFIEAETDSWIFAYLNYYLFGRVMWNKDTNVQSVIDEHHRLMFGAAAPEMAAFFSALEHHWINELCGTEVDTPVGPAQVIPPDEVIWNRIYSPAECQRIDKLFEAAESRLKDDPDSLKRVNFMRKQLWQPCLDTAAAYHKMISDNREWKEYIPKLEAGDSIAVDGKDDESIWQRTKPFYLVPKNAGTAEAVQVYTRCRAVYDDLNLYFLIECVELDTAKMIAPIRPKNTTEIWQDNGVELFFAIPDQNRSGYQFLINSAGSIASNRFGPGWIDWKWDGNIEYKTCIEDGKCWRLEMRVPRQGLGLAEVKSIAANITRHRVLKGEENSYDTWSPFVTGSNHSTENYGYLELQEPQEINLIDNGDFRNPVRDKRFIDKWFAQKIMCTDEKVFRTGGVSIRINSENPMVAQYLPMIKPNTRYRLSYYIKTEDLKQLTQQNAGVYIRFELGNGKPFLFPSGRGYLGTTHWIRQCFEFKTPEQIKTKDNNVYIRFTMHPTLTIGNAWVDKVELYEIK